MKITEKQFRKVVAIISILLLFIYPILPFLLSFLEKKDQCEYGVIGCALLSLFFVAIIFIFWALIVVSHHRMFYTNIYRVNGLGSNDSKLKFFIKSFFLQKYFFNSLLGKTLIGGTTLAFCLGSIYLFLHLMYSLIKLLAIHMWHFI